MAAIKVTDMAFGRLRAPDLDAMEEFLVHFGMVKVARTPKALFMRGTDPTHHIHVTEKGDPAFVGFAYYAPNEAALKKLAKTMGKQVETVDEPGGGKRVRLTEPNGFQIEVLHGVEKVKKLPVKRQILNTGAAPLARASEVMRLDPGPPQVKRIGHGVLCTPRFDETVKWFRDTLGMLCSDDVYAGSKDNLIGSFNRCDRGATYVDHHVLFCLRHEKTGLNHLSFEVQDVDDVFKGHHQLQKLKKYEHMWGIGRHVLGSQIFDYWSDPWGRIHEHWTDSDRMNASDASNLVPVEEGLNSQWGEPAPQRLIDRVSR
ncbi:MAG: catechol 1,2-dioxygenase [Alphaproteobacteria bacterium]|nr:catechol 1,2-dioxygenase [Alphaproteobacteria bacterium]